MYCELGCPRYNILTLNYKLTAEWLFGDRAALGFAYRGPALQLFGPLQIADRDPVVRAGGFHRGRALRQLEFAVGPAIPVIEVLLFHIPIRFFFYR